MYPPGLRLRRIREAQGLTYRDVEKASYEIAVRRGRPDFVIHISRLADIENRNVLPSYTSCIRWRRFCIWTPWKFRVGTKLPVSKHCTMAHLSLLPAHTWAKPSCLPLRPAHSVYDSNCKRPSFWRTKQPRERRGHGFKRDRADDSATGMWACRIDGWCRC